MLQPPHIPSTQLKHPLLDQLKVALEVLRLDQVHPTVSGNKFFKLKYNLEEALKQNHRQVLTFGGAYSNHIYATASAAKLAGLQSIGIIRGEVSDEKNPTLKAVKDAGMVLVPQKGWVNTIRTCVSNNAKDPSLGPPIIRLTHGVMFQDVPCIATSVNITSDPLAGYDKKNLLPRKIDVTMSLEEFRMGDLGDYAAGEATTRDNLAGWEAVIETGSTDPRELK